MNGPEIHVEFAPELRLFVAGDRRRGATALVTDGVSTLGITAGASAPEPLIEALVDAVRARFDAEVTEDSGERETVTFKLPRVLTA